ncbi:hypothetical protein GGG16DRAFT_57458 [Schizophyllum commune]
MPVQQSRYSAPQTMSHSSQPYAVPSSSRDPGAEAKRPPNAFIVFRSWYIANQHPPSDKQQRGISKKAATIWHNMSDAEKLPFERQAQQIHLQFKKEHPDFDWNKKTPSPKSSPVPSTRSMSAASSSSKQPDHSGRGGGMGTASGQDWPTLSDNDPYFSPPAYTLPDFRAQGVNIDQLSLYAIRPNKFADANSTFLSDSSYYPEDDY